MEGYYGWKRDDLWICFRVWLSELGDKSAMKRIVQWDWDCLWGWLGMSGFAYIFWFGWLLLLAPSDGHSFRDHFFFALRWALMPSVVIPGGIILAIWMIVNLFRKDWVGRLVRVAVLSISVTAGGALIWYFTVHHDSPTAKCNDGTYSYSRNHRGTCSWHGGVAEWYKTQQDLDKGK
jgi:hypothetical protein